MSLELLLVDVNVGLFKYLDSGKYISILLLNKSIFRNVYPQILAGVSKGILNDIPIRGLQISTSLLSTSYPSSLFHLLSNPNFVLLAAKNGNLQLMLMVLLHGGNLHFSTLQGDTPLHFAAASGKESLVELLIQKGARVEAKNEHNMTPLHYAALYKKPYVISHLVNAGNPVNGLTLSKRTPLHYACMHTTSVSETTFDPHKHSFSSTPPRNFPYSFFRGSAGTKNSDLLALLPVHPPTDAELRRQVDAARLLLAHGASPGMCDERKLAPLHYASFFGPVELAQLLIAAPDTPFFLPDVNQPAKFVGKSYKIARYVDQPSYIGFTPLFYACAAGNIQIVELLLACGAHTSASSREFYASRSYTTHSALSLAIQYGQPEVVRTLIKIGKDAREPIIGKDLVIQALKCQNREVVHAVLECEDNLAKNHPYLLQYVICHCNESDATYYTALFLERGAQTRTFDLVTRATPLHLAVAKNYTEVVIMLVESGADVNANDKMHRSALDMTLGPWNSSINMEIFNILLQKPITNIDQKDFMGNTILHRAVKANNLQIVEALVKRGAKTVITNRTGDTPLSLALDYRIKDYLEKVQKTQ